MLHPRDSLQRVTNYVEQSKCVCMCVRVYEHQHIAQHYARNGTQDRRTVTERTHWPGVYVTGTPEYKRHLCSRAADKGTHAHNRAIASVNTRDSRSHICARQIAAPEADQCNARGQLYVHFRNKMCTLSGKIHFSRVGGCCVNKNEK